MSTSSASAATHQWNSLLYASEPPGCAYRSRLHQLLLAGLLALGIILETPWLSVGEWWRLLLARDFGGFWLMAGWNLLRMAWYLAFGFLLVQANLIKGAEYLDDLFELGDPSIARAYLQTAIFDHSPKVKLWLHLSRRMEAGDYQSQPGDPLERRVWCWLCRTLYTLLKKYVNYPVLNIKDGAVMAESQTRPLYRIGGPGHVKIYLRSAALFERPGGEHHIYRAGTYAISHSFERFREAVDLRDYTEVCEPLQAYTRDGIAVTVEDITIAFRLSGNHLVRNAQNPYPVDELAVRRVIYGQAIDLGAVTGPNWVRGVKRLALIEMTRFIHQRLLKDLVIWSASALDQTPQLRGQTVPLEPARREVSALFQTQAIADQFRKTGVDLIWISAGQLTVDPLVAQELVADALAPAPRPSEAFLQLVDELLTQYGHLWEKHSSRVSHLHATRETKNNYLSELLMHYAAKLSDWQALVPTLPPDIQTAVDHIIKVSGLVSSPAPSPASPPNSFNQSPSVGQVYFWKTINNWVEIKRLQTDEPLGVFIERQDGHPLPLEALDGDTAGIMERFISLADFSQMLASGELTY